MSNGIFKFVQINMKHLLYMQLLIPCIITVCNQKLFKETASISYLNGGNYMALITCGMIISSESGQFLLTIPVFTYNAFSTRYR